MRCFLLFLFILLGLGNTPAVESGGHRASITIEKVYPNSNMIEVSTADWLPPGTAISFTIPNTGQIDFLIYRSLSIARNDPNPRYLARYYPTSDGLPFDQIQLGLTTIPPSGIKQSFNQHSTGDRDYWSQLDNQYFHNQWLNWEHEPNKGDPLKLNASFISVEGYLSILEVREDRIIVHYPAKGSSPRSQECRPGIVRRRPTVNLTYSDCQNSYPGDCTPAYTCNPILPKKRNGTIILVIVSTTPRPLAHFMPKKFGDMRYYDDQNLIKVDPRTIGPGFDINDPEEANIEYRHPDLLPVDSWDINVLEYYLR